jgi:hypothetical protein
LHHIERERGLSRTFYEFNDIGLALCEILLLDFLGVGNNMMDGWVWDFLYQSLYGTGFWIRDWNRDLKERKKERERDRKSSAQF